MAHFYVKSGGTASGDAGRYVSAQTGSFAGLGASNYYDGIIEMVATLTTPLADGDTIYCSHIHSKSNTTREMKFDASVAVISVSDTAVNSYVPGAEEIHSSSYRYIKPGVGKCVSMWGMTLRALTHMYFQDDSSKHIYNDCTIQAGYNSSADARFRSGNDGVTTELNNCELIAGKLSASSIFYSGYGSRMYMNGGSITLDTTQPEYLFHLYGYGGGEVNLDGVDLSGLTHQELKIIKSNSETNEESGKATLTNCKLPASWALGDTPSTHAAYARLQNCSATSAAHYASHYISKAGSVETSTAVYADSASQVDSVSMSLKVETGASASLAQPLKYKLGSVYADYSSFKNISVEIAHNHSALDNSEVWVELHRPNQSDTAYIIDSTGVTSPLDAATAVPPSSSIWTGLTSPTRQSIDLVTTSSGGSGFADIYICFAAQSSTVYVSHDVAVS